MKHIKLNRNFIIASVVYAAAIILSNFYAPWEMDTGIFEKIAYFGIVELQQMLDVVNSVEYTDYNTWNINRQAWYIIIVMMTFTVCHIIIGKLIDLNEQSDYSDQPYQKFLINYFIDNVCIYIACAAVYTFYPVISEFLCFKKNFIIYFLLSLLGTFFILLPSVPAMLHITAYQVSWYIAVNIIGAVFAGILQYPFFILAAFFIEKVIEFVYDKYTEKILLKIYKTPVLWLIPVGISLADTIMVYT